MDAPPTGAAIVIRRPAHFVGGARSFVVWIDGRRVGKVRPHAVAEFAVEPGEHTVAVSMDWFWS